MNLIKTSVALATFAALAAPTVSTAAPTVYGKINAAVQVADDGAGSFTEVHNAASRLGFKGSEKINDDLMVIYQAEFGVDLDKDTLSGRNQFIGLQGNFGQVVVGRNDTMLKKSQGKVDLFGDLEGDIAMLYKAYGYKAAAGENRLSQTVSYLSPCFSGIHLGLTYVAEKSASGDAGYSLAAMYGDKSLKKSPIYASVAYDSEVNGYDVLRATVQGKVADFVLGGMYQSSDLEADTTGIIDSVSYMVNAAYKGAGNWTPKIQYQMIDDGDMDLSSLSVGADYKLSSATKAYAFYTARDLDDASLQDQDYIGVGMEHKF